MSSLNNTYIIVENRSCDFHAGSKATMDVERILLAHGIHPIVVGRLNLGGLVGKWVNRIVWFISMRLVRLKLPRNATIIMQYPSSSWSKHPALRLLNKDVKSHRQLKLIALIHDIASLRSAGQKMGETDFLEEEASLFDLFDKIIVHNESMANELVKRGVKEPKIVCLQCFDYITKGVIQDFGNNLSNDVVVAGNLSVGKCGYLAMLKEIEGVRWRLYGSNYDPVSISGANITYKGVFSPEDLPSQLKGSFGLVWDGVSVDTCSGNYGEYLRINNPHKMSLYLASGLPVIVWEHSATAGFVRDNGVGLAVKSLLDIPAILGKITLGDYSSMKRRAVALAIKLRSGQFTMQALECAID